MAGRLFGARGFWGVQTGPNPTDRAKLGSKRHLICDGWGVPLAIQLTAANRNDSQQALSLVDAVPLLQGERGRPRHRPVCVLGDRGYDAEAISYLCLQCATQSTAAAWDDGDGSSSEPSRGCINSGGCVFAMKGVPTYTRHFSCSRVR